MCGPPGSGKSAYVKDHASPGDLVVCFDRIAALMFGSTGSSRERNASLSTEQIGDALRERNECLADLMRASAQERWSAAWLIVSEPRANYRQWWWDTLRPSRIVVLEAPIDVCKQRVLADASIGDARHSGVERSIDAWWADYTRRDGDQTIV